MPYETAYIGIATTPSGGFDHFVRQLKTSHLAGGYWRFQSTDDDRRAYARGFTTQEDVLCATESTSEGFDEIAKALGFASSKEAEKIVRAALERLRRRFRETETREANPRGEG